MRKLCSFAIPCAAAIFAAVYLLPETLLLPAAGICALAALPGLLLRGDPRLRAVLLALGLAAGFLWTAGYDLIFYAPARWLAGTEGTFTATVTDYPAPTRYGSSVQADLHTGRGPDVGIILYASQEEYGALRPGDRITFPAQLRLADTSYGEETDYYRSRGIFLIANAQGGPQVERPDRIPLRFWPGEAARAVNQSISRCFDPAVAPIITALITGDLDGLSGDVYSALQRTGLAHTVSVSGLHVSFLAGVVVTLLGPYKRRTALVGIGLLIFFAALAGATPSVLRAVILQSFLLLAPLLGREYDRATALSAALLLLLLANPYAAASVSLQLSFASVAGIYLLASPVSQRITGYLPTRPKGLWARAGCAAVRFCAASLGATAGALLFTTPLTAWYFGTFSLITPVSNLVCLWAVSLAFLGGLAAALAGLVWMPMGAALGVIASLPARFFLWMTGLLARFPFASVSLEGIYLALWLLLAYAIALLCLFRPRRVRPVIPLGVCAAALCAALVCTGLSGGGGSLTVAVLDVGQGQSVLLRSGGRTALVDCGGTGRTDPGDVAADYVQSLGQTHVDLLILTHCHADHAGGVPRLFSRLKVDTLLLPAAAGADEQELRSQILTLARQADTQVVEVGEDLQASLGQASLTVYAPLGSGSTNEAGLSVLCSAGAFDALITGDMDARVEEKLIAHAALPKVELLVAGHHGSSASTSQALLDAVRPEYAAISVGYNSYGHPTYEVLERLEAAGCRIYRTDWMGTLRFTAR